MTILERETTDIAIEEATRSILKSSSTANDGDFGTSMSENVDIDHIVTKTRCWLCGRENANVRLSEHVVESRRTVFLTPDCPKREGERFRCKPFSLLELQNPSLIEHHTRLPPDEAIDRGILAEVKRCHEAGLPTLFSCDGHGHGPAYIEFWPTVTEEQIVTSVMLPVALVTTSLSLLFGPLRRAVIRAEHIKNPLPFSERRAQIVARAKVAKKLAQGD